VTNKNNNYIDDQTMGLRERERERPVLATDQRASVVCHEGLRLGVQWMNTVNHVQHLYATCTLQCTTMHTACTQCHRIHVHEILHGSSAQLGYTVSFTLLHAGKYRTEDKFKIQTIPRYTYTHVKYNSEQESPADADIPARCKTMKKIPPFQSYNKFQSSRKSGVYSN